MNSQPSRVGATPKAKSEINLHEIDIENLAGSGLLDVDLVREIKSVYMDMVPVNPSDVIVVAAGPQNRRAVYEGWGGAQYVWRAGRDGADIAIAQHFLTISDHARFSHLYLATGDGGLAPLAAKAQKMGLEPTIVTGSGFRSWKLNQYDYISLLDGGC